MKINNKIASSRSNQWYQTWARLECQWPTAAEIHSQESLPLVSGTKQHWTAVVEINCSSVNCGYPSINWCQPVASTVRAEFFANSWFLSNWTKKRSTGWHKESIYSHINCFIHLLGFSLSFILCNSLAISLS